MKYLPLINCEIYLILAWSEGCVISSATRETNFKIADTKLYVSVVTLLTQDNAKLLQQLKSGFKRIINWNKYQPKFLTERQNQYLDFLIDPGFPGVNRIFVLSLENGGDRKSTHRRLSSKSKNKKLQYYDWWKKMFLISQLKVIWEQSQEFKEMIT